MPPSRQWAKRLHRGHSLGDSGNRRARRFYDAAGWSVDGATKEAVIADVPVREVRHCRSLWAMPRVANPDPAFHTFVAARQRLAGVEPPRDAPSGFAMAVRRQHDQVELGGQNVLEVELWYDVPKGAPVSGVRLSGDSDPEGFQSDQTVAHAPDGVLVPLTPAR